MATDPDLWEMEKGDLIRDLMAAEAALAATEERAADLVRLHSEELAARLAAEAALVEARQETERWRRANGEVVGMIAHFVGSDVEGVNDMRAQLQSVLDAVREDSEAERDALAAALRLARQDIITVNTAAWDSTRGQAALAAITAIDAALASVSPSTQGNPAE